MIDFDPAVKHWRTIQQQDEARFNDTRTQAHWAAQVVAAAANTLLPRRDDDSQSAMHWLEGSATLASPPLPAGGLRAGLSLSDLALQLLTPDGGPLSSLPMAGRTLANGLSWLEETLAAHHVPVPAAGLQRRELDLPDHDVAAGGRFLLDAGSLTALENTYTNGARFLAAIADHTTVTSPPLCWPHHFDLGMIFAVDAEAGRSVGCGLSPGDHYYAEPYWYVAAYPQPSGNDLPPLAAGHWHREDWTGAVLSTPDILEADPAGQARLVANYLDSALEASRALLA